MLIDDSRWFDHDDDRRTSNTYSVKCFGYEISYRYIVVIVVLLIVFGVFFGGLVDYVRIWKPTSRYKDIRMSTMSLGRRKPRLISPVYDAPSDLRTDKNIVVDSEGVETTTASITTTDLHHKGGKLSKRVSSVVSSSTRDDDNSGGGGGGTYNAPTFVNPKGVKFESHTEFCDIDVIRGVSHRDFHANYVSKNRPVVLEGVLTLWRALKSWSFEKLGDGHEGLMVNVTVVDNDTPQPQSLKQFVENVRQKPGSVSLEQWPLFRYRPELRQDCFTPPYFIDNWAMFMRDSTWRDAPRVCMLSDTFKTKFKTEPLGTAKWIAVLQGERSVALVDPYSATKLGKDRDNYNAFKQEKRENVHVWRCRLSSGQLLYVPSGWWWQQKSVGASLSVSDNIVNGYNLVHALTAVVHQAQAGFKHDVLPAHYLSHVLTQKHVVQATESFAYISRFPVPRPLSNMLQKFAVKQTHIFRDSQLSNFTKPVLVDTTATTTTPPPTSKQITNVTVAPSKR